MNVETILLVLFVILAISIVCYDNYKYQELLNDHNELEQNYKYAMDMLKGFMEDKEGMRDSLKGIDRSIVI